MGLDEALHKLSFFWSDTYECYAIGTDEFDILKNAIKAINVIKEHKLLNHILENNKFSTAYGLTEKDIDDIKEIFYE